MGVIKNMIKDEVLMTRSYVTRDLRVSECTVDNLARSGRLPSMMTTAKRRVFRQSDVERLKAQLLMKAADTGK